MINKCFFQVTSDGRGEIDFGIQGDGADIAMAILCACEAEPGIEAIILIAAAEYLKDRGFEKAGEAVGAAILEMGKRKRAKMN